MEQTNKPIRVYKAKAITLSVWENEGENDKKFNSITFQRSYLDKEEQWQHTQSLHVSDLPILQVLLEEAYKDSIVKEN
ncbi:MAG: hypothetical protein VX028_02475 [Nanoarchaeota archaeon]|nr:hypothetical protein [Nanoarchaeota archaeon]